MTTMLGSISESLIREDGSITVVFAVTLLVILTAAGIGTDYSNAHRARTLVQTKVDAAVLAGASVENVTEDGKSAAIKFLDDALESENMSDSVISRVVSIDPDTGGVSATVRARINTYLLQVVGKDTIDLTVTASAARARQTRVLDISMCIDATGSMQSVLDAVKNNTLSFFTELNAEFAAQGIDSFASVRVRPIFFRDYGGNWSSYDVATGGSVDKYPLGFEARPAGDSRNYGDDVPMRAAPDFFNATTDAASLFSFVDPEVESGGGDYPESALECLNEAIDSPWLRPGDAVDTGTGTINADTVFSVIAIWTDQDVHAPGFSYSLLNSNYPPASKMPRNYADLTTKWSNSTKIPQENKLLALFIPTAAPTSGWEPIMDWDRLMRAGTLTDGTDNMVRRIAEAVATIDSATKGSRLTN